MLFFLLLSGQLGEDDSWTVIPATDGNWLINGQGAPGNWEIATMPSGTWSYVAGADGAWTVTVTADGVWGANALLLEGGGSLLLEGGGDLLLEA